MARRARTQLLNAVQTVPPNILLRHADVPPPLDRLTRACRTVSVLAQQLNMDTTWIPLSHQAVAACLQHQGRRSADLIAAAALYRVNRHFGHGPLRLSDLAERLGVSVSTLSEVNTMMRR
jgi:AraC-like DNA-binding protein